MTSSVLRVGDRGEPVRDLQTRLAALGLPSGGDPAGEFGAATEAAVRRFQESRRIRVDGIVGRQTWSALVETGYALGDRLLSERRPMLRGDDVLDLQRRLNALGFDAGREDGIFGPDTGRGLRDFQRNAGISNDGIVGPSTVAALDRLGVQAGESVAAVREREALRTAPRDLVGRRVFLATPPELARLGAVVERHLAGMGATVVSRFDGAEDSALADEANRFGAALFLALRPGDRPGARVCYFESQRYRSEAGYRMAAAVSAEIEPIIGPLDPVNTGGRMRAVLRETRMAAIVIEPVAEHDATDTARLVQHLEPLGQAVARGVRRGIEDPLPDTTAEHPAVVIPPEA